MKNARTYIPCVLLTIILVFSVLGTGICIIADKIILNENTCIKIIDEKELTSKVKSVLDKTFENKSNSTGIPPEVYNDVLSQQWLDDTIKLNIIQGFGYLNGSLDKFDVSPDFESIDKNITDFFSSYADENGYIKDSSYNDKLQKEIDNTHSIIINYTDIFKINTLYDKGVIGQVRRYIDYLDKITYLCIGLDVFCIVILLLLCLKNTGEMLYWSGCGFIISAIIGLVPCVYITSSKYFDSFVIKQEQIFTAFTSYMYKIVDSLMALEIGIIAAGVLMIVIYTLIGRKKQNFRE